MTSLKPPGTEAPSKPRWLAWALQCSLYREADSWTVALSILTPWPDVIADAFEPRREPLPGAADQGMLARAAKEKAWGAERYLLLAVGSHLLLSCLGFSSASYLKVHVKTHHGVPLPQVSRHREPILNGGAAFHCARTYGNKGKRPLALHFASLRRLCCEGAGPGGGEARIAVLSRTKLIMGVSLPNSE